MAGNISLALFAVLFSGFVGYQLRDQQARNSMVHCRVVRVVDGPDDEPVTFDNGQIARPYTIVANEPQYRLFVLPGIAGTIDEPISIQVPNTPR